MDKEVDEMRTATVPQVSVDARWKPC